MCPLKREQATRVSYVTPAVCTAAHSALLTIRMHSRQCIIMANNALWAAGVVVFAVLLHDRPGWRVNWPCT